MKLLPFALIAVLAVAVVLVGKPAHLEANASEAIDQEDLQYPVDLAALRSEFRQTGAITLRVPVLGEIRIAGDEYNLTREGNRNQDLPHIAFLGTVFGYAGSTANMMIGEYGVYGSASIPIPGSADEVRYTFDAIDIEEGFELLVRLHEDSAPPEALQPPPKDNQGLQGNETR